MENIAFRQIICGYGVPDVIVIDNETIFANNRFQEFLDDLKIKQHFTFVECP